MCPSRASAIWGEHRGSAPAPVCFQPSRILGYPVLFQLGNLGWTCWMHPLVVLLLWMSTSGQVGPAVTGGVDALCAWCKKGKKMFFFLLVPEAIPERVTSGKRKCGHVLKDVQDLGHPLCRLCGEGGRGGGAVGSEVFITPKLLTCSFYSSWFLLWSYSPAQKPWTILQICFGCFFLSLCLFLGLFSFWCGNNYIACFLCSVSD